MSRRDRKRPFTRLLLAVSLATVGCSELGAPPSEDDPLDTAQTQADFDAMNTVFESDVWESFGVLGELFPLGLPGIGTVSAVRVAAGAVQEGPAATEQFARTLALELQQRVPRIPDDVRGVTFVIDPETYEYVPSDRAGAPATGVRFILYAINPVTHKPILDVEIGYTDLIDLGDDLETAVSLRFVVVSGDVTYLDYTVTVDGGEGARTLAVEGFVGNGETVLEFVISLAAEHNDAGSVTELAFELAMPDRDFAASATVRDAENAEERSRRVTLDVHVGDRVIGYISERSGGELHAEIYLDGELFAIVSGTDEEFVITGPNGEQLTEHEVHVLRHIVRLTHRVFEMFERLMRPVERILRFEIP